MIFTKATSVGMFLDFLSSSLGYEIVFGMVHGQPFEGLQKIPYASVLITCHWNLRTGHLGKSIASPFMEILPTLDLLSAPAYGE